MHKTKDCSETKRTTTEIGLFMRKTTQIKVENLYIDCQNEKQNDWSALAY